MNSNHRGIVTECELSTILLVLSEVVETDSIIIGKSKTCKSEG